MDNKFWNGNSGLVRPVGSYRYRQTDGQSNNSGLVRPVGSYRYRQTDGQSNSLRKQINRRFSYSAKEPGSSVIYIYFYICLYARFDQVALELLSLLCTFEKATKCRGVSPWLRVNAF